MAKTNQQIIVTEGDFGVEILTQFIDDSKKPISIEGCSCKIKFAYDGNVIAEKTGVVIDEPKGIVSVVLDIEETQYSGLWTSYWICYDQFNNVTTTENIYYYVQPAIGSVNNPAFKELLNYYNRDEVNNMFKSILEQLNNYTLTEDEVEEYIKIYAQDKIDEDFIRQCILDAVGSGNDYAKKEEVGKINSQLTNDIETINSQLGTIATVVTSSGSDDTNYFKNILNNSKKIYIPPTETLLISSVIPIESDVEIYGGGNIKFIGNFSKSSLLHLKSNNITINNINFLKNNLDTTDRGFISTDKNLNNINIINSTFKNGGLIIDNINNSNIKNNKIDNGFIVFYGGNGNKIISNYIKTITSISSSGVTGLNFIAKNNDTLNDYIIKENTITNICYSGITMQGQGGSLINCIIDSNIFYVQGNTGTSHLIPISLANTQKITCLNNIIYADNFNGHYYAIECVDSNDCVIENNRINNFKGGIIINGTSENKSFNNIVKNNYIKDFKEKGIHLYRYTSNNVIYGNILESTKIAMDTNVYAVYFEGDGKTSFKYNSCNFNKIKLNTTNNTTSEIFGIRSNSSFSEFTNNLIEIKSNNKTNCLFIMCGWGYGQNLTVNNNNITLDTTDASTSYGIKFSQNATDKSDYLNNSIVQYNRIITSNTNKLIINSSKIGNGIYENNFLI